MFLDRLWVETRWFQKFWLVRREYANHLALQCERNRRQDRENGLPTKGRSYWSLLAELLNPMKGAE
jgi:hypothetical protein